MALVTCSLILVGRCGISHPSFGPGQHDLGPREVTTSPDPVLAASVDTVPARAVRSANNPRCDSAAQALALLAACYTIPFRSSLLRWTDHRLHTKTLMTPWLSCSGDLVWVNHSTIFHPCHCLVCLRIANLQKRDGLPDLRWLKAAMALSEIGKHQNWAAPQPSGRGSLRERTGRENFSSPSASKQPGVAAWRSSSQGCRRRDRSSQGLRFVTLVRPHEIRTRR